MSSLMIQYQKMEQEKKRIEEAMNRLENDDRLAAEMVFLSELEALMEKHGKTGAEVAALVSPAPETEQPKQRRRRTLKRYTNPHTGEHVETRGGNNKKVREWKDQYGDEEVVSWAVVV